MDFFKYNRKNSTSRTKFGNVSANCRCQRGIAEHSNHRNLTKDHQLLPLKYNNKTMTIMYNNHIM